MDEKALGGFHLGVQGFERGFKGFGLAVYATAFAVGIGLLLFMLADNGV